MQRHHAPEAVSAGLRRVVLLVALLNLAYFGLEFGVALAIGSVSLLADSIDFLEDTSVNLLILVALGWSAKAPGQARHGACGLSAGAGSGRALDSVGETRPPHCARCFILIHHGHRSIGREHGVRAAAGPLSCR